METILKDCSAGILIRSEVEKAVVSLYPQVKNPIADGANLEKVETQKTVNSQSNLEKDEQSIMLLNFKLYFKARVIKTMWH